MWISKRDLKKLRSDISELRCKDFLRVQDIAILQIDVPSKKALERQINNLTELVYQLKADNCIDKLTVFTNSGLITSKLTVKNAIVLMMKHLGLTTQINPGKEPSIELVKEVKTKQKKGASYVDK